MGYFNQEAITKKYDFNRYSVRLNSDFKIGKRIRVRESLGLSAVKLLRGSSGGGDGDIRFADHNGRDENGDLTGQPDGMINADDRTYLGKPIPDFFYGLTFTASYKNFDFSMYCQGVQGIEVLNSFRTGFESMSGLTNQWASVNNRWTGSGTSNAMPRAVRNGPNANNRICDRGIEDGSFLCMKNFQPGYTIPAGALDSLLGSEAVSYKILKPKRSRWVKTANCWAL